MYGFYCCCDIRSHLYTNKCEFYCEKIYETTENCVLIRISPASQLAISRAEIASKFYCKKCAENYEFNYSGSYIELKELVPYKYKCEDPINCFKCEKLLTKSIN